MAHHVHLVVVAVGIITACAIVVTGLVRFPAVVA